jgi:hypothetical protein
MTPKEKAEELVDKFKPHSHFWVHDLGRQKDYEIEQLENAKQCALIAVDEKISLLNEIINQSVDVYQSINTTKRLCVDILNQMLKELKEVKEEIEKL